MNYLTPGAGARRQPTTLTWLGFGAALAAVLGLLVLVVAVVFLARWDRAGTPEALGTTPPAAHGGLGAAGSGANRGDEEGRGGEADRAGQGGPDEPAGGGANPPPAGPPDQAPEPAGPQVEYFQVSQQPQCPGGTNLHPTAGQPVVLEWQVAGTDEVSISIDGPGVYQTYPATGSDTISFPCEGEAGDTQKHTYLLTAVGEHGTTTETLVVTAEVQEVTEVPLTAP